MGLLFGSLHHSVEFETLELGIEKNQKNETIVTPTDIVFPTSNLCPSGESRGGKDSSI